MEGRCPPATGDAIIACEAPDLLRKNPNGTFGTYFQRQMTHLEHASETLAKNMKIIEKPLQKHMQHPYKTLATYV